MKMIKVKDLAMEKGVTPQAIYKHIRNHSEELENHIEKKGNSGTWLDEFACEFISNLMSKQPIVLGDKTQLDQIEELRKQNEQLLIKIAMQADQIAELSQSNIKAIEELSEMKENKLLIEQKYDEQEHLKEQYKAVLNKELKINNLLMEEYKEAYRKLNEINKELFFEQRKNEIIQNRGLFKRIRNAGVKSEDLSEYKYTSIGGNYTLFGKIFALLDPEERDLKIPEE